MTNIEKPLAQSPPELQSLIENFKIQNRINRQFTAELWNTASSLKPIREENAKNTEKDEKVNPRCAVDYFWAEINFLKETNERFQVILDHLQQVIG